MRVSDIVLEVRNSQSTKRWQQNKKTISAQDHKKWFNKHKSEFKTIGDFGYVRLQPYKNVVIAIKPDHQGKGHGYNALKDLKGNLLAKIHKDNKASKALFKKLGFKKIEFECYEKNP